VNFVGGFGDQNLKFSIFFKNTEKNKKFIRKTGIFYAKLILVFGVTLKQMTVDT